MLNTADIQQAFEAESKKPTAGAAPAPAADGSAGVAVGAAASAGAAAAAPPAPAPAAGDTGDTGDTGAAAAAPAPVPAEMEAIRNYFKSQGIEMSPEEIATKVKAMKNPPAAPAAADHSVDDAEVEQHFASLNKKEKYEAYKASKDKSDLELVMDVKKPLIKEKFPNMTDEQLETFIKRSYFQDEDGYYEEDEKNFGSTALANEAASIRSMINDAVDGAKTQIQQGKIAQTQSQQFAAQVDSLLNSTDKISFKLGVSGMKDLGNWDLPLHAETKAKVKEAVISPQAFAKYVSDPATGQLDLKKVVDMVTAYELQPVIAKSIATEYHSRGVTEVEALLGDGVKLNGHKEAGKKDEVEEHNKKQASQVIGTRYR